MSRPNILLIMTDQQRFDTIATLGNPVIKTPHLDRLASEGTAFTSAYTPSPVCMAARCSMHYGQYPMRTGCYENFPGMPQDGRPSFMDLLTGAGYRTHGVGKCHFYPDEYGLRGFQSRDIQEEWADDWKRDDYMRFLRENGFGHILDPHGMRGEMYYIPQLAQMPAHLHPTQWVGDRATDFIEKESNPEKPWMLFASFIHPHPPFVPPAPWHKLYRAPLMPHPLVPVDGESLLCHVNRHQNRYKYRDQGIDRNLVRNIKAFYYASISFVDYQVGRILHALEARGELDNTLILFTSDHGELLGDYNSFGKRSMHDASARIPLLARWPERFQAGARCASPSSLVDIFPTLCSAASVDTDGARLDGIDLAEIAAGRATRSRVLSQMNCADNGLYMAVSERHKLVYSAPDQREWFYDRVQDPLETRNRIGSGFLKGEVESLRNWLQDALSEAGEHAALEKGAWKKYPVKTMPQDPDTDLIAQDQPWNQLEIAGYNF